ncbi:7736_t:CDS:2, partial [Scutellospora calospora]
QQEMAPVVIAVSILFGIFLVATFKGKRGSNNSCDFIMRIISCDLIRYIDETNSKLPTKNHPKKIIDALRLMSKLFKEIFELLFLDEYFLYFEIKEYKKQDLESKSKDFTDYHKYMEWRKYKLSFFWEKMIINSFCKLGVHDKINDFFIEITLASMMYEGHDIDQICNFHLYEYDKDEYQKAKKRCYCVDFYKNDAVFVQSKRKKKYHWIYKNRKCRFNVYEGGFCCFCGQENHDEYECLDLKRLLNDK